MDQKLRTLMNQYVNDFTEKKENPLLSDLIVKDSIPVVYFGDLEKYLKSKRKVVTVAINPSDREFFYKGKPVDRFNKVDFSDENAVDKLKETLDEYFEKNPYTTWFNYFENALTPLKVSYFHQDDEFGTAIHIDIYTSIATAKKWGALKKSEKEMISNTELFKELLKFLNPDLILFSSNREVFGDCFAKDFELVEETYQTTERRYFRLFKHQSKEQYLIWGLNRNNPFGGLSKDWVKNKMKEWHSSGLLNS